MWKLVLWTLLLLGLVCQGVVSRSPIKRNAKGTGNGEKNGNDDNNHNNHWSYEDKTGPKFWPSMYKTCSGSRQSPIDIETDDVDLNEDLDEIDFEDYDDPIKDATLKNNGHTVVLTPGPLDVKPQISDGGLDDSYEFVQLHFHWGANSKRGSEHTIDDKSFPLEMHLVHKNTEYKTMEEALMKPDGLAVLAVLFKIDDEDNEDLESIIEKLDEIKAEDSSVELEDDIKLEDLLPDDTMPYYRYIGSLTTPPCSEVVTWTIFEEFVPISEKQLEQFRNLKEEDAAEGEEPLVDNFRPPQEMHGRVVEISGNSAIQAVASVLLVLVSFAFTRLF